MKRTVSIALLCALFATTTYAGSKAEWKKRSVYQVITDRFAVGSGAKPGCDLSRQPYYCGGNWDGTTNNLQYIKDLGFDAIWITPVVDNTENGFHGYWAANWEKINTHFGDENSLKRLVSTAHSMGMWVMVDVVANHVGPVGDDFSKIYPFNKAEHYHSKCQIQDWNNQQQVENCRLADLPDLNQDNSYVRSYLKTWIKNLVQTYNFDGIRIDTIPEVPKNFWKEYAESSGVFQMGECFNGNSNYVGDYQNYVEGLFNYPMYYTIRDVFQHGQSMKRITQRWAEEESKFRDIDALGIFVDNHDNPRFLNGNGNPKLFKSALAFGLTARGIPFYYYGSEQGFAGSADPYNREAMFNHFDKTHDIYQFTSKIMKARKSHDVASHQYQEKWSDDTFYAFSRGDFFVALTNQVNGETHREVPNTGFAEGSSVCNIFYPTDCVVIKGGNLSVYLENGEVKIFVPKGSAFFTEEEQVENQFLTE